MSSSSGIETAAMIQPLNECENAFNTKGLLRWFKGLTVFLLLHSNVPFILFSIGLERFERGSFNFKTIQSRIWPVSSSREKDQRDPKGRPDHRGRRLKMITGGSCLAKVDLALAVSWMGKQCGEDAWIIASTEQKDSQQQLSLLSVADGVGGWAMYGGDSSKVSKGILSQMSRRLLKLPNIDHRSKEEKNEKTFRLSQIVKESFADLVKEGGMKMGSTTLTASLFDPEHGSLEVVNIGDSMLAQFRKTDSSPKLLKCIFQTPSGTWAFNSPHQIGFGDAGVPLGLDPLEAATHHRLHLQSGDFLVLGSDGLWDNVWMEEIEQILVPMLQARFTGEDSAKNKKWTEQVQERLASSAKMLSWMARMRAEENLWTTPFSAEAVKAGKADDSYRGGKVDDVAVIIAMIVKEY